MDVVQIVDSRNNFISIQVVGSVFILIVFN